MSSLLLRFSANARELVKRSLYAGCTTKRHRSTDAATATKTTTAVNRQNDPKQELIQQKLTERYELLTKQGDIVPAFKRALSYGNKIAIKDETGEFSYAQLFCASKALAKQLSQLCGDNRNKNIAFLCPNTAIYSVVQWACWIAGHTAVPLSARHPANLLEYYIKDSEAEVIITTPEYEKKLKSLAVSDCKFLLIEPTAIISSSNIATPLENITIDNINDAENGLLDASFYRNANAMILYTSGSTGLPKGALISHRNLQTQTNCLSNAWKITRDDSILHILPLNHVHGSVNALLCPLSVGAKVHMQSKFDPSTVWSTLLNVNAPSKDRVNLFMAVPTIYSLLIAEYEKVFSKNDKMVEYIRVQCEKRIRLMVSGSAPLSIPVFDKWLEITGHKLLERYGMTEIGMALSNPYKCDKTRDRIPGTLGAPLPECEVKIMKDNHIVCQERGEYGKEFWSDEINPRICRTYQANEEISGELFVRGPSVFAGYYKKPDETENSFSNGWFKTGDVAKYENGVFKILGRMNIDIIKSGAYKVSALEIETHLMEHPSIIDVCIVGVPDATWGQKIAALIVNKNPKEPITLPELTAWCDERIAPYQIPTTIKCLDELPRNAMGKLNKKEIVRDFFLPQQENDLKDTN